MNWDAMIALLKRRGLDASAFHCAYDVLSENGLAIVPREATEEMVAAAEFNGPLDPTADAAARISAALSAGEIAPKKGEG